jgi:hypothetical protein
MIDALPHAFELHVETGDFFGKGLVPAAAAGLALVGAQWRLEPAT